MKFDTYMILEFPSKSCNEAFARSAVSCFAAQMDPTIEELGDIRTAVSEAVTNAVIHGYENISDNVKKDKIEKVIIRCTICGDVLHIEVKDTGKGIENIEQAMEPLFTTKPELERSGMGFTFMETFMDSIDVFSNPGAGTKIIMRKTQSWS